jgi:hypothetical protein
VLIENEFTVSAPIDHLWAELLDDPRIAPALPGAELTETVDGRDQREDAGRYHADRRGGTDVERAAARRLEEADAAVRQPPRGLDGRQSGCDRRDRIVGRGAAVESRSDRGIRLGLWAIGRAIVRFLRRLFGRRA